MNHDHSNHTRTRHSKHPYGLFALNMVLSFVAMYFLMFTMIDTWKDFYNNINMLYMALTMLAPMGIVMLITMGSMYTNKRLNIALYAGFAVLFIVAFAGIRTQTLIGDDQFISSMIPHHSGAILMCSEAKIADAELEALCTSIEAGQRKEIEQMKAIRARLHSGE